MSFAVEFNKKAQEVHFNAIEKGWWASERNKAELIALAHSELSEALEALREGDKMDDKLPNRFGCEVELADCIIRIMDMSNAWGMDLGGAIEEKIAFNKMREYKHGKVF
jgi:NTP pyrophosphatase (non-canonical NTP hydrolase)